MTEPTNDRPPNFRSEGKLYIVRCYICGEHGRENWAPAVASGRCAWCGSGEKPIESEAKQ